MLYEELDLQKASKEALVTGPNRNFTDNQMHLVHSSFYRAVQLEIGPYKVHLKILYQLDTLQFLVSSVN
jgi:hypothetical protein